MWHVEQKSRNVSFIHIEYDQKLKQRFLLAADRHWDNPKSNWKLQRKHLKIAKSCNAGIIDVGDFFCAMQGKFDKRGKKSDVRPMHQVDDYLDSLVQTAADFIEDYTEQFIMIGLGNHETSILKKHEVNLTNNLVRELNQRKNSAIYNGGYSGWVQFIFTDKSSGRVDRKTLWYMHGYGGGGPVTRGVIQTNRRAVYLPDPDIIVTGHIHDDWRMPIQRVRLDPNNGEIYHEEQMHVQCPTYKDEYADGYDGWHVETGKPPKPIGAMWLEFRKTKTQKRVTFDVLRAR